MQIENHNTASAARKTHLNWHVFCQCTFCYIHLHSIKILIQRNANNCRNSWVESHNGHLFWSGHNLIERLFPKGHAHLFSAFNPHVAHLIGEQTIPSQKHNLKEGKKRTVEEKMQTIVNLWRLVSCFEHFFFLHFINKKCKRLFFCRNSAWVVLNALKKSKSMNVL